MLPICRADSCFRPRGAHINPERWNKTLRSERQSSYSDDYDSDDYSTYEVSEKIEQLTPKSLVDEGEIPIQKKSNTGSTVADSNIEASDAEAEYLASEEEEYEADPFEQELSDGLSVYSADDANNVTCKMKSRGADCVTDEIKSDVLSPLKHESEERSWHSDWNADGFSHSFATKASGIRAPAEVYNAAARLHTTPFGQKVLNAMRQPRSELESEPSITMAASNPSQSRHERPSSPSDAALFKATSVAAMAKAEVPQIPLNHEDSMKSTVSEVDSVYGYFVPGSQRRNSSPPPYPANISNTPEALGTQSYYQSPFQMPSYRDSIDPMSQKGEDTSFTSFGNNTYPSRPPGPTGYRWYPNNYGYGQDYTPNEVPATSSVTPQPCWRNTYYSVTPSPQTQAFPMQPTTNEEPTNLHVRSYAKPTMLTISEIVSEGTSGLPGDQSRGTKRKADDMMEDDTTKCQAANSAASEDVAASFDVVLPDAQPREDMTMINQQSQALSATMGEALRSEAPTLVSPEGPAKKKSRTDSQSSVLRTTRTFVSGMLAGGLSVFGALLVYGATAPDSIQDRVRLEFS